MLTRPDGEPARSADLTEKWLQRETMLLTCALLGLAAGGAAFFAGAEMVARMSFSAATLVVLAALLLQIISAWRRREFGLDVIALFSMTISLIFGEYLTANVIALMYAGGQLLESYARRRSEQAMTALLGRVSKTAHRYLAGSVEEVPVEAIAVGDILLIRKGDIIPADGTPSDGPAWVDQSALTGEPLPVEIKPGHEVRSGSSAVGEAFKMRVTASAAESSFAQIVRLVSEARRRKAPMVRMSERYSTVFLALTVSLAGVAWLVSNDPMRILSVFVVATPCPLILAAPVAFLAGLSRCARAGVIVKGGDVLERMAAIKVAILDKTGTVTLGVARIKTIATFASLPEDEVLAMAASLDQASAHVIAEAVVAEARRRGLVLAYPTDIRETAGLGIAGKVDGHAVAVGAPEFALADTDGRDHSKDLLPSEPGDLVVAVAVDGVLAGALQLADLVRPDIAEAVARLRKSGVTRLVLASGDQRRQTETVGAAAGFDAVHAELLPGSKVDVVRAQRAHGRVMMIGDGVNDAPALASADVGVAMGARGSAASAETADAVLLVDRILPVADAVAIAQRTVAIAHQSVLVGMGLSVVGMIAGAAGYLPPLAGAVAQEVIDVAVILNALRALR
jgi:heavy metal translocating P-type ATPase